MSKVYEGLRPEYYDLELEVPDEHPGYSVAEAGTKALDSAMTEVKHKDKLAAYWLSYLGLLYAIGRYVRAYKLKYNAYVDGVYPTQVVLYNYFPDNTIYRATEWYRVMVWRQLRSYEREAGFVDCYRYINKRSWDKFFRWVACEKRLAALRKKAQRELKNRHLMSAEELVTWYVNRHPGGTGAAKFP